MSFTQDVKIIYFDFPEEDTHEDGELDDLNAEADIPLEDLLRKFHPELFDGKTETNPDEDGDKATDDKNSSEKLSLDESGRGKR